MDKNEIVAKFSESIYQFCRTNMYLKREIPITNAEMGTLILIYNKTLDGATTIASQIAEYFDISKPSITLIINKLQAKEYLQKVDDAKDKRKSYIALTNKGIQLIESHQEAFNKKNFEIIEKLGYDKAEELIELLDRMTDILKK